MSPVDRSTARRLAKEALAAGEPLAWFERLYALADGQAAAIPWADLAPNPHLAAWMERQPRDRSLGRVLVVGCGLGDDAEALARRADRVVAFDVSATAVAWCLQRFSRSTVRYVVADVLTPPAEWRAAFDLVVEVYTLQVLPPELRRQAAQAMAAAVAPGGRLLAVARGRSAQDPLGEMPWPLLPEELSNAFSPPLMRCSFEDFLDQESPPVRRLRAEFQGQPSA
ncbi:MAG: class I SAM-dependent methyltransferase [Alphaproteobacteria bacterium]|nr:class I SAM-dependent methyltransferase [Alphaproteobacteria bacterium]